MSVQDHPLYPEWETALDSLIDALSNLREAVKSDKGIQEAQRIHDEALENYKKISLQIG